MIRTVCCIFFFFVLIFGRAEAQNETFEYRKTEGAQDISSDFQVFTEKEGETLSPETAAEQSARFEKLGSQNFRNLPRFWGRLRIRNTESDSAKLVLNLQEAFPDFARMYFLKNGKWTDSGQKTGRMESLNEKVVPSLYEVSFRIDLAPGESRDLLFLFENVSRRNDAKTLAPKMYDLQDYRLRRADFLNRRNPPNAGFHSILWILLIYNLFIFLISRDRIYLLYSFYMLFVSVYMLNNTQILVEILYPGYPVLMFYISEISSSLAIVFYILFMSNFLELPTNSPLGNKIAKAAVILKLLVIPLNLALIFLNFNGLQVLIGNLVALICVFVILGMSLFYISRYRNNMLSRIFFAGNTVLASCFIVAVFILIVYRQEADWAFFLIKFGVVAEILIFSLGLGYRAKLNEEEKRTAQEKLIVQLRENEQLQTKVNRELEEKVMERTKEITVQNEELQQQQEEISAQNDFIDQKNRELNLQNGKILDSIRYAQTIQEAFLPSDEELFAEFPFSFVIFRPKDIVSGDFYWLMRRDNYLFLAVSDCTGHGVPGGFMSMIGNEILTESVLNNYTDPAEILTRLDSGIRRVLRQEQERNDDGMDIGIYVRQDDAQGRLKSRKYAGAKQSLFIVRAGELTQVNGVRRSVGGKFISQKVFESVELSLFPGDRLFLSTDGMPDQNNSERKKLGKKQFTNILISTSAFPFEEQKSRIEDEFDRFSAHSQQRDDITLFGFQIG